MLKRIVHLVVLASAAWILLQPSDAAAKTTVKQVVVALAGKGGLDGVELFQYYAKRPDQLSCLNSMVPFPTATVPSVAAIAAARGLRYAKLKEGECTRILNPASSLVDELIDSGLEKGLEQVKNSKIRGLLKTLLGDIGKAAEKELCRQIDEAVDKAAQSGFKATKLDKVLKELKVAQDSLPAVLRQPSDDVDKKAKAKFDKAIKELKENLCKQAKAAAKSATELMSRYSLGAQAKQKLKDMANQAVADAAKNIPQIGAFFSGAACGCPLAYHTDLSVDEIVEAVGGTIGEGIQCLGKKKYGCFVQKFGFELAFEVAPDIACDYRTPGLLSGLCKQIAHDTIAAPIKDAVKLVRDPNYKNAAALVYSVSKARLVVNLGKSVAKNKKVKERMRAFSGGARDAWNKLTGDCPLEGSDNKLFGKLWADGLPACSDADTKVDDLIQWAQGDHYNWCKDKVDNRGCYKRSTAGKKCRRLRDRFVRECWQKYASAFSQEMKDKIENELVSRCGKDGKCEEEVRDVRDRYVDKAKERLASAKSSVQAMVDTFASDFEPKIIESIEAAQHRQLAVQWAKGFKSLSQEYIAQCRDRHCVGEVFRRHDDVEERGVRDLERGKPPSTVDAYVRKEVLPYWKRRVVASVERDEGAKAWKKDFAEVWKGYRANCRDRRCKTLIKEEASKVEYEGVNLIKDGKKKSHKELNKRINKELIPKWRQYVAESMRRQKSQRRAAR